VGSSPTALIELAAGLEVGERVYDLPQSYIENIVVVWNQELSPSAAVDRPPRRSRYS
jgi:hypothetical protein